MNKYLMDLKVNLKNVINIFRNQYADFNGRTARDQFWYFVLAIFLCYLIISILSIPSKTIGLILSLLFTLATVVPCVAIIVRRVRDAGIFYKLGFLSILLYAHVLLNMMPASYLNIGIIKVFMALLYLVNFVAFIALFIFCVLPSKED